MSLFQLWSNIISATEYLFQTKSVLDLVTNILYDSQHKTFCIIGRGRAKHCMVSGFMKHSSFYTGHICIQYIWDGHMTTHSLELEQKFTMAVI